jgi:hypothetical protein
MKSSKIYFLYSGSPAVQFSGPVDFVSPPHGGFTFAEDQGVGKTDWFLYITACFLLNFHFASQLFLNILFSGFLTPFSAPAKLRPAYCIAVLMLNTLTPCLAAWATYNLLSYTARFEGTIRRPA